MTVSVETLPYLADGVIELHEKGFLVSCNLAYDIDWSASNNKEILDRELHKLITYYLDHPYIEPCTMLSLGFFNIGTHADEAIRFCGAGQEMSSYDVDGNAYPCQFFMPLSVGKEKAAIAKEIVFPETIIPEELLDEKCRGCILRSACPNCYGANFASTGSIYKRDDNMCRLTKITMKARSYFRAKQWEAGQLSQFSSDDLQAMLKAIVRIQEELEL